MLANSSSLVIKEIAQPGFSWSIHPFADLLYIFMVGNLEKNNMMKKIKIPSMIPWFRPAIFWYVFFKACSLHRHSSIYKNGLILYFYNLIFCLTCINSFHVGKCVSVPSFSWIFSVQSTISCQKQFKCSFIFHVCYFWFFYYYRQGCMNIPAYVPLWL